MAIDRYTLVIGDKNISSWSLRPWLALKQCRIPFTEERVRLRQPDSKAEILRHTPAGKVPVLKTDHGLVWDSLAILEILAERHPEHRTAEARAAARSILSAEMHRTHAAQRHVHGSVEPAAVAADQRGARWRISNASPPSGGDARRFEIRSLFVWRLHQCRRHVCAGGDPLSHLWGSTSQAPTARAPPIWTRSSRSRPWPSGHGKGRPRSEGGSRHLTGAAPRAHRVNTFLTPVPNEQPLKQGPPVASARPVKRLTHGKRAKGLRGPTAAQNGARGARHHGPGDASRRLHADRFAVRASGPKRPKIARASAPPNGRPPTPRTRKIRSWCSAMLRRSRI